MSLINDALKKAQRQRGDETAAELPPAGPGGGRVPRREKPPSFQTLLVRLAVAVIAVCAIIITAVLLLRRDAPSTASVTPPAGPAPVASGPAAPASDLPKVQPDAAPRSAAPGAGPAPVVAAIPPTTTRDPNPVPATDTGSATPPAGAAASASAPPAGATGVPSLTLPPIESKPAIAAPSSASEPDKRILAYLSELRVSGIRPAGLESKVLMNDRVYKLNDVVDYNLGLKLTGIAIQRLEFVDERGVGYVKQFGQ